MRTGLTVAALLAAGATASAQTGWGIWNNGPGSQTLVTFNTQAPAGAFTVIGPTGVVSTTGFANSLEFGAGGSNLFMAINTATNFLYDVNQGNGAASNPRGSGLAAGDTLGDMSYDHFSGRMLGIGTSGVSGSGARLYEINTTTGVATSLGTIGGGFTEGFTVSMAVRPSDGLIFLHGIESDRWHTVNPGTLVATALDPLGVNTNFGQGASFHAGSNTLYHAMLTIDGGNVSRLATINQVTGAPTFLGNMGVGLNQVGDIAFPVPTPGSALVLGAATLLMARRRRNA